MTAMTDTTEILSLESLAESGALRGKRVLIRADLNVPLDAAGAITDDTRIRAALESINLARNSGASVRVMSHLGRPKEGQVDAEVCWQQPSSELSECGVRFERDWLDRAGQLELWQQGRCCLRTSAFTGRSQYAGEKIAHLAMSLCMTPLVPTERASTHAVASF